MAKAGTAWVEFEPDFSKFDRAIAAKLPALAKSVERAFDPSQAKSFNRELGSTSKTVTSTDRSFTSLGRSIGDTNRNATFLRNSLGLIKFPALIAGAGAAVQGLSALGAGATALTSALAPLSGALVAFPAALGAIGQGAATAGLAFSGLGEALSALQDAQMGAGEAAKDAGDQQRAAADQVRTAEQSLATAQRSVKFAQEDLTAAREDAVRQLQDMHLAASGAALGEKQALLSLHEARRALREMRVDPDSGMFDRRSAILAVEEAEQGLTQARLDSKRSQDDLNKAERAGVSGAEQVVGARRALADAQRQVANANHDLASAQRSATEAMQATGSATDSLNEKMAGLPPTLQEFAHYLFALKPRLDAIREIAAKGLLPGVQSGIDSALKNFPALESVIEDTASAMGHMAERTGHFLGREGFGRDFATIGRSNAQLMERWGGAGLHLADALRHVMVEARPLLDWMARSAAGFSKLIEDEAKAGRESGRLADFFGQTRDVMERLTSIGGSLASVFQEIGHAAAPLGRDILKSLDEGADNLERWAESTRGRADLREYFEDARKPIFEIGRLIGDVTKAFFEMSRSPGLTNFIRQFRVELLPVLVDLVKTTTRDFGPVLIDFLVQGGKLMANFVGSAGPLTLMVRLFTEAAKAVNALFENVEGLASAMSTLVSGAAIGKVFGAFKTVGAEGGAAVTRGFTANLGLSAAIGGAVAALTTSGGVLDTLKGEGASWGKDFAASIAQAFGPKLEQAIERRSLPALRNINRAIGAYTDKWGEMFGELPPELTALADKSERALQRTEGAMERVKDKIHDLSVTWHGGMRSINRDTEQNMRAIERSFGSHSQRGKQLLSDNFDAAIDAIRNSMDAGKIATERGQRLIQDILGRQLKLFGVKPSDLFNAKTRSTSGDSMPKGGSWTHQRGGLVQFGRPGDVGPDNIFTRIGTKDVAVAPGEVAAVFNRHQLPVVNQRLADMGGLAGFFERFKRPHAFQSGGLVQALGPYDIPPIQFDPGHAGTNSHLHISMASVPSAQAIAKQMRSMGWGISETPWAGGLTVTHSDPGHYTGSAFDANTGADETRTEVAAIARLLSGQGGGAMVVRPGAQIKLPVFDHKGFPLSGVVAGGLNRTSRLIEDKANSLLSRLAVREGAEQGVGFAGMDTSGSDAALMKRISEQRGWNFADWWALDAAESSHGANLVNPTSTARLRGQFLDMNWGKYGPGSDPAQNPSMAQQIVSMAAYIAERYGNPTRAWAWHQSNNWYKRGGIIAKLARGGLLGPGGRANTGGSSPLRDAAQGVFTPTPQSVFTPTPPGGGDGGGDGAATFGGRGLGETFKHILGLGDPGARREAIRRLIERIKKIVPEGVDASGLAGGLKKLRGDADIYADLADRASQLSTEAADGTTIAGIVGGRTEVEWTTSQLSELFQLRNRIIEAEKVVELRRDLVTRLLERTKAEITDAEGRLRILNRDGRTPNGWEGLNPARGDVSKWNALGDPVRLQKMRKFLRQGGKLPGDRTFFEDGSIRTEDKAKQTDFLAALRELVVPAFTGQRSALNDARGTLLSELDSVQGVGAPMEVLSELPALGALGGEIFSAQMRLRDLVPREDLDDLTSGIDDTGEDGSDLAELFRQQRDAAWADLNVMRAQQPTLSQFFAKVPFAGTFHEGGVVQGHGDKYARVKGGEGLFTEDQMAAMGGGEIHNHFYIDGKEIRGITRTEISNWEHEKVRKHRSGPTVGRRLGAAT